MWQAEGNDDEWFKVDLGKIYTINNVVIQWDAGAYAADCEILISQDDVEYTSVYSITGWDSGCYRRCSGYEFRQCGCSLCQGFTQEWSYTLANDNQGI